MRELGSRLSIFLRLVFSVGQYSRAAAETRRSKDRQAAVRHCRTGVLSAVTLVLVLDASAAAADVCRDLPEPFCDRSVHGQAVAALGRVDAYYAGAPEGRVTVVALGDAEPKPQGPPDAAEPVATLATTASPPTDALSDPDWRDSLCVDPRDWLDPDIDRNKDLIDRKGICIETLEFVENRLRWRFQIFDSGRPGHNWILLHDDEDTAFDAALYAIAKYGGKAVEVDLLRPVPPSAIVDPNHNFATRVDQRLTCRGPARPAAPRFTSVILEHLGQPPYLALHNNYDGHFRSGGNGNLSVRQNGRALVGLPTHRSADRLADEDNFIIVSGLAPPLRMSEQVHQITDELRNSGINVIYEYVNQESYDCSLSNYLLIYGGVRPGEYFNIEAEEGDYRSQITMIDALFGRLINPPQASR